MIVADLKDLLVEVRPRVIIRQTTRHTDGLRHLDHEPGEVAYQRYSILIAINDDVLILRISELFLYHTKFIFLRLIVNYRQTQDSYYTKYRVSYTIPAAL